MGEQNYWSRVGGGRVRRRALLRAGALAAIGSAALAAACRDEKAERASDVASGQATAAPASAVDLNATLKVAIIADTGNYDPQSFAGIGNQPNQTAHFDNPLVIDPEKGEVAGYLADWRWADGNTVLEFKIKPSVKFHNGEPLDAQALKFNFDRPLERGTAPGFSSGRKSLISGVGEITVVDGMTLKVAFTRPDVAAPIVFARTWPVIAPEHAKRVGDQGVAAEPVGTGPFRFLSRVRDTEIRSARNDAYFNPRDVRLGPRLPYAANLVQLVRPEVQARLSALEAGEIDLAVEVSPDLAKTFEGKSDYKVFYVPQGAPLHVQFSTLHEKDPATGELNPWRDKRVRLAANMAVDLDTITKKLLTGREPPAFGPPSDAPGFPRDIVQKRFKFDPRQARTLLAEAGYPNGFTTNYFFPPDSASIPGAADVAPALAGYLADIGIKCTLRAMPQPQFLEEARAKRSAGMFHLAGTAGDVNVTFLSQVSSSGPIALSVDPALRLDPLIEQQAGEFDAAKRASLIREITTRFYENASWLFLYEPTKAHVGSKRIEWTPHFRAAGFPEYWNIKALRH